MVLKRARAAGAGARANLVPEVTGEALSGQSSHTVGPQATAPDRTPPTFHLRPPMEAPTDSTATSVESVSEELDVQAMIDRFRERADAVRRRGLPPVEGDERRRIMAQMRLDFQDFAMLGDATGSLENGVLTLRVDLRRASDSVTP